MKSVTQSVATTCWIDSSANFFLNLAPNYETPLEI